MSRAEFYVDGRIVLSELSQDVARALVGGMYFGRSGVMAGDESSVTLQKQTPEDMARIAELKRIAASNERILRGEAVPS